MSPVVKSESKQKPPVRPRVLVVDDEPNLVELVEDVGKGIGCNVIGAADVAEARKILAEQEVDLLVADLHLPDGNGMHLLPALREQQPGAAAIVITGAPSLDNAIGAIRGGAVDFLKKPFTVAQLTTHLQAALARQAAQAKQDKRVEKLRIAVRKLNEARRTIGKKVDLLCNDLVTAYGELSRQFDGVRNQESFRKVCDKAQDLEQLLCHAMDWLLRELGYANVAVWLADEEGDFQLGAYMKYTVAGEPPVTNAIKQAVLPLVTKDQQVHLGGAALAERFSGPAEQKLFKGQDLMGVNCTYLGDSLAALVFFRDARSAFTEEDAELLKAVAPVFAIALATVVRGADEEGGDDDASPFLDKVQDTPRGGDDDDDADDTPAGPDESNSDLPEKPKPNKKGGKPKVDPADWWKRGEAPPF
jgi:FixJ family two-component response regulator